MYRLAKNSVEDSYTKTLELSKKQNWDASQHIRAYYKYDLKFGVFLQKAFRNDPSIPEEAHRTAGKIADRVTILKEMGYQPASPTKPEVKPLSNQPFGPASPGKGVPVSQWIPAILDTKNLEQLQKRDPQEILRKISIKGFRPQIFQTLKLFTQEKRISLQKGLFLSFLIKNILEKYESLEISTLNALAEMHSQNIKLESPFTLKPPFSRGTRGPLNKQWVRFLKFSRDLLAKFMQYLLQGFSNPSGTPQGKMFLSQNFRERQSSLKTSQLPVLPSSSQAPKLLQSFLPHSTSLREYLRIWNTQLVTLH